MEDRKNAGREVSKNDGTMQRAHKQLKNTRAGQRNRGNCLPLQRLLLRRAAVVGQRETDRRRLMRGS